MATAKPCFLAKAAVNLICFKTTEVDLVLSKKNSRWATGSPTAWAAWLTTALGEVRESMTNIFSVLSSSQTAVMSERSVVATEPM